MTIPLTEGEMRSDVWRKVHEFCTERLQHEREANDSPKTTESETAQRRGRIAAYKEILAMGDARSPVRAMIPIDKFIKGGGSL